MQNKIIEESTNDFCETYQTKDDCKGVSASLIPYLLPDCINPNDPRVIQIVEWCKEIKKEEIESQK